MGQKGAWPRLRDLLLNFGTPITSGSDEATDAKFCSRIGDNEYQTKNEKLSQKGRGLGHVTYCWILAPPIISGSDKDTNVKFCSRIDGKEYQTKNEE